MTRTFIALEMHEVQQRHLAGVIRQMAIALPSVRWVDPASIHLTLAFLGELTDSRLTEAIQATKSAAQQSHTFSYRLTHPGFFGSPRQPRVIWLGIDESSGTLLRLHRVLNQELAQRNFDLDSRPFSPHLTLARIKSPLPPAELQQLQAILAETQKGRRASSPYTVQYLNVMKSELSRAGAQYTSLCQCALG